MWKRNSTKKYWQTTRRPRRKSQKQKKKKKRKKQKLLWRWMSDVECGIFRMENSMLPALHAHTHTYTQKTCLAAVVDVFLSIYFASLPNGRSLWFRVRNLKWTELKFNKIICDKKKRRKNGVAHTLAFVWTVWINFIFLLLLKAAKLTATAICISSGSHLAYQVRPNGSIIINSLLLHIIIINVDREIERGREREIGPSYKT